MTEAKLRDKRVEDIHKLVFLANEHPQEPVRELATRFAMSALDLNAAIWRAQELGYLFVDAKTGHHKVEKVPKQWKLGEEVEDLKETLLYVLGKLAEEEQDLEKNALDAWVVGVFPHDLEIAKKQLLDEKKIAVYDVVNITKTEPSKKGLKRGKEPKVVEDTYTFYTLYENGEQQWGRKRFKDQSKLK